MRGEMTQCDRLGRHASEQLARFLARQEVQATLPDIAAARREAVAEERHEAEHMVRCHACISVLLLNRQAGLMIQQAIQHIRRFASSRRAHPPRQATISYRDLRVTDSARFVARAGVTKRSAVWSRRVC